MVNVQDKPTIPGIILTYSNTFDVWQGVVSAIRGLETVSSRNTVFCAAGILIKPNPAGGYSELMQEMMASWGDFMDYQPERDDRFEEGDRKSRGKFTWKTRLRQLNNIVQYGMQKEEIMGSLRKQFLEFLYSFTEL